MGPPRLDGQSPLAPDLERTLEATAGLWEEYRGARIFLTGGTGFFGSWLLEALIAADRRHGLGARAVVLTRDPDAFRRRRPHLAGDPLVSLRAGDVLSLRPQDGDRFSHVVHAAAPASARLNAEQPLLVFDTVVEGTRNALELARAAGARRFLFTSSGAAYGPQPPDLERLPEEHPGAPDPANPLSAYGEGKRAAEFLCAACAREHGFEAVVARCFAFSGPYLPLDGSYALGNFVRDALRGGPVEVAGDGTPLRSYLYGADLAAWLWTLLARGGAGRTYNVGSESALSIAELAALVARLLGVAGGVRVARSPSPGAAPERYVPSTRRAREELGLAETFALEESILRMHQAARESQRQEEVGHG